MAHVLICGMSESGKTTLARGFGGYYRNQGFGVLVLDPLKDPRWQCDFITANQEEFLDVVWKSRRCILMMDEGGKSVGRYNYAMQEVATMGRHWGHSSHFISQDPTQLAPIIRDQCRHVFLFCASDRVGKKLADEFNQPALLECGNLKQGEYIRAARFGGASRHTFGGKKHEPVRADSDRNRGSGRNVATEVRQAGGETGSRTAIEASEAGEAEGGNASS